MVNWKRDRLLRDNFDLHLPIEPLFLSLLNTVGLLLPLLFPHSKFLFFVNVYVCVCVICINDRFVKRGKKEKKKKNAKAERGGKQDGSLFVIRLSLHLFYRFMKRSFLLE